ncbi:GntR family transcriptional regulator [Streptomyces avermitilis]|uniref:GntR family transcriptional regulator n=1 Tax=Streptomyces avermitilis TaxID=33903 RepID=UPI003411B0C2
MPGEQAGAVLPLPPGLASGNGVDYARRARSGSGVLRGRSRTAAQAPAPGIHAHDEESAPDDYTRARAAVLARISDGTLPAGMVIDQTDLALRVEVPAETVRSALDDLADIQMVEHHPQLGYFVADAPSAQRHTASRPSYSPAPSLRADAVGIRLGETS